MGIESSCDETAVALVEDGRRVLASLVASQTELHMPFGGVVPEVAAREHLRVIAPLATRALAAAGAKGADVDAIAVTQGPGLIGALLVGVAYAKGLALALKRPLVPVDHVHAHVHGALLGVAAADAEVYPTLALVVSGGHTNLYRLSSPTAFQLLGSSVDDACGECFDKVAKLLGLGYPGGPAIERLARGGDPRAVPMPRMVSEKKRLEFSYAGLKTYVANYVAAAARSPAPPPPESRLGSAAPESRPGSAAPAGGGPGAEPPNGGPWGRSPQEQKNFSSQQIADLCASFQDEALGQIVRKLKEALRQHPDARSVLVAGGVAANQRFRALMAEAIAVPAYFPAPAYCSDNAAMIAAYGFHVYAKGGDFASHDWDAYSRYDYAPR